MYRRCLRGYPIQRKFTPASPPRLGSIELCRGIAAVLVVFFHSNIILGNIKNFGLPPFGQLSYFGRSGVDFFFVLSGFLISLLHWRDIGHPQALRHYAIRRLTRIYPSYWLVLAAVIPGDIFLHTLFDHYDRPLAILQSVLLIPQGDTILGVTWSLRHELLFYIFFGAAIFRRSLGIVFAGLWLICLFVAWDIGAYSNNMSVQTLILPLNFEFFAGVVAGWAFGRFEITRPAGLLAFGLACFAALWLGDDFVWPVALTLHSLGFRCLGYSMAASAVVFGLSALELRQRFVVPKFFVTLGGASYLLYLIHVPALLIVGVATRSIDRHRFGPDWAIALVFNIGIAAAAILVHLKIERPLLRAIRGRTTRPCAVDDSTGTTG